MNLSQTWHSYLINTNNIVKLQLSTYFESFSPLGFSVLQEELCTAQHKQKEGSMLLLKRTRSLTTLPSSRRKTFLLVTHFSEVIPKTEGDGSASELLPRLQKEQVQQVSQGKCKTCPEESSLEQQECLEFQRKAVLGRSRDASQLGEGASHVQRSVFR